MSWDRSHADSIYYAGVRCHGSPIRDTIPRYRVYDGLARHNCGTAEPPATHLSAVEQLTEATCTELYYSRW